MSLAVRIFTSGGFQRFVNRKRISTLAGRFASREWKPATMRRIIRWFISSQGVNMEEYEQNVEDFKTFNAFFTRTLKPGARAFGEGICSPVDGFVSEIGAIENGSMLQVKGSYYSINQLVGDHFAFTDGSFATIYLSPADYHRIHAPFDMHITEVNYIPGDLFSVNEASVSKIEKLFCRNERVVLKGTSEYGAFYFVLVGAIVVGKIKLSFMEQFTEGENDIELSLKKGEELGMFELGSTVILTLDNDVLLSSPLRGKDQVRMGIPLCSDKG